MGKIITFFNFIFLFVGELDEIRGIFPRSYVNIIVDCTSIVSTITTTTSNTTNTTSSHIQDLQLLNLQVGFISMCEDQILSVRLIS